MNPLTRAEYQSKKAEYLKKLGVTEREIRLNQMKKEGRLNSTQEKQLNFSEKARISHSILIGMPGETIKEKRLAFYKISESNEFSKFIGKKIGVGKRRQSPSQSTASERIAAGIDKLQPAQKDILKKLINEKFSLDSFKTAKKERGRTIVETQKNALKIIKYLDSAGIIKRKGNKKITEINVLDRKRLNKTLETGYVQWPELKSIK